jgi:hypothetical protein
MSEGHKLEIRRLKVEIALLRKLNEKFRRRIAQQKKSAQPPPPEKLQSCSPCSAVAELNL